MVRLILSHRLKFLFAVRGNQMYVLTYIIYDANSITFRKAQIFLLHCLLSCDVCANHLRKGTSILGSQKCFNITACNLPFYQENCKLQNIIFETDLYYC